MKIKIEAHQQMKATVTAMRDDRLPFWNLWRELADYYLPQRYSYLQSPKERSVRNAKNPFILDGTGTNAARTLASGMMNGITSPSRPWFKLRVSGFDSEASGEVRTWLDECERRMMLVMAESNFYNSIAILHLDLAVFGTAAQLIYEDYESVIRCYNPSLGEYYLRQSARGTVDGFAREIKMPLHQIREEFGEAELTEGQKARWNAGGAGRADSYTVTHLLLPEDNGKRIVEHYWSDAHPDGEVLRVKYYHELPGIFPRWELSGGSAYGVSPGMDALGDVIQLQHETKKKGQALDKLVSPPVIADIQLQNRPTALLPNGITYVSGINNVGVKPIYTVNPPLGEMTMDIRDVQGRIRETFHNDLFKMISQLETVRSATEIDARREEKLVLLGSVLERFENEALDPAINRIFNIMARKRLLPPAPAALANAHIEIQYMSILSTAQRSVAVIPTERWLQLIGGVAPLYPNAVHLPNWDTMLLGYGRDIGVPAAAMNSLEKIQSFNEQKAQEEAAAKAMVTGTALVGAGEQLSKTEVGGGANALQRMLGG